MPGYEDLTPDQIIYIANLVFVMVVIFSFTQVLRALITWKVSENVKSLELMIEKKIDEGIVKPSFFESIKSWWTERKKKKEEELMYKPFG